MLNYHPVGDLYHCIYRLLLLTAKSKREELEWDRLRLMDFYFLFPHLLANYTLSQEYRPYKKIFSAIKKPYEETAAPARLYFQLGLIQENAIRSMIAKGYFDRETFITQSLIRPTGAIPEKLAELIKNDPKTSCEWFEPFLHVFLNTPLLGQNGVKSRSGVMEYRYDTI